MRSQRKAKSQTARAATVQKPARNWLLFVHQLRAKPSTRRVQTWRRLQQFGAIPLKQAVYSMSSAWLIRRFIDAQARFGVAPDRPTLPDRAVPFEMFGVEFSHRGNNYTFETLCSVCGVRDVAVTRVAAGVHDLDLKMNVSALLKGPQLQP